MLIDRLPYLRGTLTPHFVDYCFAVDASAVPAKIPFLSPNGQILRYLFLCYFIIEEVFKIF
ncbi:hypothetical protein GCM10022277_35040 [Litoribacillus peritrichatus]|uniref:Transposase n=1 Tax=Litoribacillus peritrichatus TaxID=718191 RepID=A0ABP7N4D3_9GAMM